MVVCQFYLRDQCKFGSSCRNEHPVPKPTGFGSSTWGTGAASSSNAPVAFNVESIQRDFGPLDKPMWPLSSYGAAKGEPTFLEGLDISPEELRARAFEANKEGKMQEYAQYEANAIQNANTQFSRITSDSKGAFEAAFQLSKTASGAPNPAAPNPAASTSAFGGGNTTSTFGASTTPAFGQPSASAFGQSAFGQAKPFGGSAFGASTGSAFGQSAFGSSTNKPAFGSSAFGQPSTGFGASTSGSAFGASTSGPTGFGASTSGGGFSAFAAKPTTMNQPSFGQSGFGALAAAATGATPAYAQPDPGSSSTAQPFGGSAFGSSTNNAPQGGGASGGFSAFASAGPSAFGTSTASTNPFGQSTSTNPLNPLNPPTASTTSAFGQPSQNPLDPPGARGAFGQGTFGQSAFGQPAFGQSAFGQQSTAQNQAQTSTTSQPPNPFGQSTGLASGFGSMGLGANTSSTTTAPSNPFGAQSSATNPLNAGSAFGASTASNAPVSAFGSTPAPANPFGAASTSNQPAPQAGMPAGQQTSAFSAFNPGASASRPIKDRYASQLPQNYMEMLPPEVKEAFERDRFIIGDGSIGVPTWIPPLEMR